MDYPGEDPSIVPDNLPKAGDQPQATASSSSRVHNGNSTSNSYNYSNNELFNYSSGSNDLNSRDDRNNDENSRNGNFTATGFTGYDPDANMINNFHNIFGNPQWVGHADNLYFNEPSNPFTENATSLQSRAALQDITYSANFHPLFQRPQNTAAATMPRATTAAPPPPVTGKCARSPSDDIRTPPKPRPGQRPSGSTQTIGEAAVEIAALKGLIMSQAHALDIGNIQTPHGDFDVLLSKGLVEGQVFYSAQLVRFLRVDGVKHFMVVREARAPWPPLARNARRNPYVMALEHLWDKLEKATVEEGFGMFFEGTLWAGTYTKKVFREDGEDGGVTLNGMEADESGLPNLLDMDRMIENGV